MTLQELKHDWEEEKYFNGMYSHKQSTPRLLLGFSYKIATYHLSSTLSKTPGWRLQALVYDIKDRILFHWKHTRWQTRKYKYELAMALAECGRDYDAKEITKAAVQNEFYTPRPPGQNCPRCGSPIEAFDGMVGETMLMCSRKSGCNYGWCDYAGAIRNCI